MPRQNLIYWFKNIWALQIEYLLQSGCLKVSIINTVILYYLPYARSRDTTCYWPGFLASLINRNWLETRQEIQARLYWDPCCSRGSENKQQVPLLVLFPWAGGRACSLYWVRVGVCPGIGWRAGLGGIECREHMPYPAFCSGLFKSGSWVFWALCIFCPEFAPTANARSYF